VCLVSDRCLPQSVEVLRSRAEPLGIDLRVQPMSSMRLDETVFAAVLQYPDESGAVIDLREFIAAPTPWAHASRLAAICLRCAC
jgi:glycine dehydrogenase